MIFPANETDWEPMPTYWQLTNQVLNYVITLDHYPSCTYNFKGIHCVYTLVFAALFTLARSLVNKTIGLPLGKAYGLDNKQKQLLESGSWGIFYIAFSYPLLYYTVYLKHRFLQRPSLVWNDYCQFETLSWDINLNYLIWTGYVVHTTYAITFVEKLKGREFAIYLAHHCGTIVLLNTAYGFGCPKAALLTLLIMETTNIPVKTLKFLNSIRIQNGHEVLAVRKMCIATVSVLIPLWIVFRLYWYPLKVLYVVGPLAKKLGVASMATYVAEVLLLLLMLLNVYWFVLILGNFYKQATGKRKKIHQY